MSKLKIFGIVLIFGTIMAFGSEIGERLSFPGVQCLVPNAEAIVGRPLTPVSVAGVARRTVRRCAVGAYNCNLSAPPSLDSLPGQISFDPIPFKGHQAAASYLPENARPAATPVRPDLAAG